MKYFTKEWCFNTLEDKQVEEIVIRYNKYIDSIFDEIPFVLKILIKNINIHDGIIKKIFCDGTKEIVLKGVFGDLQTGYFFMDVRYVNVSNLDFDLSKLKNQKLIILSNEIEMISKKQYLHSIFFSLKEELHIFFEKIEIKIYDADKEAYKGERCEVIITGSN